jgi:hypothetical protein
VFETALLSALDSATASAAAGSAISSEQMHAAYREQLLRDLRTRLSTDPDYEASQFPDATRYIAQHPNYPPLTIVPPSPAPTPAAASTSAAANAAAPAVTASTAFKPSAMDQMD